jgi:hypothetical protein
MTSSCSSSSGVLWLAGDGLLEDTLRAVVVGAWPLMYVPVYMTQKEVAHSVARV